jgi:hypothetical protein
MRVLDRRVRRKRDIRLEAALDKVCWRRDVVSMGDVHVSAGKGIFLCVQVVGIP